MGNELRLRARSSHPGTPALDTAICGSCGSAWFPDLAEHKFDYPDSAEITKSDEFQRLMEHYIDLVGGLDWKSQLVERVRPRQPPRVLEVGCNAGLLLDYLRVNWGAEVRGIEPSSYGVVGAELLELDITQETLAGAGDVHGEVYDLVISTEVLEHVTDPVGFLTSIFELVAPGGTALITTPRSESLTPETPIGELYAALSVGAHYFLASLSQITKMAEAAGFEHCHIEPFGMTHVLYARKTSEPVGPPRETMREVSDYYTARAVNGVRSERVNLSNRISATATARALGDPADLDMQRDIDRQLLADFAIDVHDLAELADRIDVCETAHDLGCVAPYSIPEYFYWRGHADDISESQRTLLWETGALFAVTGLQIDPVHFWVVTPTLDRLVTALGERPAQVAGERLRNLLATVREASHLTIVEPPKQVRAMQRLRSIRQSLRR